MNQEHRPRQYLRFRSGRWERIENGVIAEAPLSLTVNGEAWLTFLCTPSNLEALAVGFLFNEGVIETRAEIALVQVCPQGDNVDVWLTHTAKKPSRWRRTSGCTGGATAVTTMAPRPLMDGFALRPDSIGRLMEQLLGAQELYRRVGGVHTSVLSDGERVVVSAEDIGRHNTLDKIAGLCLLNHVAPSRRILLTTGRISSEMMQKAVRIGASVVISRTSPSALSIAMAEAWGVTLVGYARHDQFNVYTHPERISPIPHSTQGVEHERNPLF